jgi:hypothetical protein
MGRFFFIFCFLFITVLSCSESKKEQKPHSSAQGTYYYDKDFLLNHDSSIVELKNGSAFVLVSPTYQAKVFTSTADGNEGKSFGWINYKAFSAPTDPHMNAFGGEREVFPLF